MQIFLNFLQKKINSDYLQRLYPLNVAKYHIRRMAEKIGRTILNERFVRHLIVISDTSVGIFIQNFFFLLNGFLLFGVSGRLFRRFGNNLIKNSKNNFYILTKKQLFYFKNNKFYMQLT